MSYIRVRWIGADYDMPVLILSELDAERWETRKLEIFADGSQGYAAHGVSSGSTILSLEPLPSVAEIASDPQFRIEEITEQEFEAIWRQRDMDC